MKKFVLYILVIIICLNTFSPLAVSSYTYKDGFVKIGEVSMPFSEYMPGTYFTKDGTPCTCHDKNTVNCVLSGDDCNCLRFITVNGKELDLLAVQCIGFARYCFYRLFGFIDHDMNSSLFYNAGTIENGQVTADSVKNLINTLKPGAHIRFKLAYTEHSVILLSKSDKGFTVYQANSGGNEIPQGNCIVSTKTYTWESFAAYAYRGIVFAHMPNSYPENIEYSDTPFEPLVYKLGQYKLTDNLKLRAGNGTSYEWLDTLPKGTVINVTEVKDNWGAVNYNGKFGWICLDYASYSGVSSEVLIPKANSGIYIKNGFVFGISYGTNGQQLLASFDNNNIVTSCTDDETVATGTTISIKENDKIVYTATVVVKGDVNGDGLVTTSDCVAIRSQLITDSMQNDAYFLAADINGNGIINTTDYKLTSMIMSEL